MLAIVVFIAATVLAVYLYRRFAERSLGPPSRALLPGADSPLDRAIGAMTGDPETSPLRRFLSWFLGRLPIESQL